MSIISNSVSGLSGLFIDDRRLAIATGVLQGGVAAAHHAGLVGSAGAAILLCGGLALVILQNVLRSVRDHLDARVRS